MIIYIFNNFLHDNAGFSKRCRKEIELLSQDNEIEVVCRSKHNLQFELFETKHKKVPVHYFDPHLPNNKRHENYRFPGLIEAIRNADLFVAFSIVLIKVLWKNRKKKIQLYTVVSPLTIPLISSFWGKLFNAHLSVVEFHDLEPEIARHSKHLSEDSLVMKIEYLLEKFACRNYNKVILTAQSQADILKKRTSINSTKILFIPNSLHTDESNAKGDLISIKKAYKVDKSFVISYVSSYNQDYTVSGAVTFIKNHLKEVIKNIPRAKLFLVGGGDGLDILKQAVDQANLNDTVVFTGGVPNVSDIMLMSDVCIIPWEKDQLSESILPSKLFDYMAAKKVIIAPNFGEFKNVLTHKENAYLYNTYEELSKYIIMVHEDKKASASISQKAYKLFLDTYTPAQYEAVLKRLF